MLFQIHLMVTRNAGLHLFKLLLFITPHAPLCSNFRVSSLLISGALCVHPWVKAWRLVFEVRRLTELLLFRNSFCYSHFPQSYSRYKVTMFCFTQHHPMLMIHQITMSEPEGQPKWVCKMSKKQRHALGLPSESEESDSESSEDDSTEADNSEEEDAPVTVICQHRHCCNLTPVFTP